MTTQKPVDPTVQPLDQTAKPPKSRKRRGWVLPAAVGVGALLVGITIGNSGEPSATPGPTSTETVTAQAEPAPTVTETAPAQTETVERTPQACLSALDDGDTVIGYAQQALNLASEGFDALSTFDNVRAEQVNQELLDLVPVMQGASTDYAISSAECRAAQ